MAKMNLLEALEAALTATKAYIDDNHYNQTEVDTLLALKQDASSALKLGTSSSTAFRGDQGLTAYNHSQAAHAPSNAQKNSDITKAEIEAKLTGAITSHTHSYAGSSSAGGAATSANKVNSNLKVQLNGGTTEGTNQFTFDGSTAKTINITPSNIGAAASSHGTHVTYSTSAPAANGTASAGSANNVARGDHVHPLQTSVSGNAGSANKVNNNLVIKINGGTTEGTNMFTFNGSAGKTIDIKASALGAPASHNHDDRYYTETEIDTKFGEVQDDIQAAVDGYEGAIAGAKTELQTAINNEATSRANADNALDARLDVLEGSGTGSVAKALTDAKSYTDTKVAAVLDSAPETLDTLNELAAALGDDPNFATTIANQIGGKAPTSHASTATTYGVSSASNYGHAKASGTTPKANGTAAVGSETSSFARGDHVHPLQTSVSGSSGSCTGNAATASKVNNSLKVQLNGGTTEGTNQFTFDGSAAKTINITPSNIGASASGHTHSSYVNQNAFSNVKVGETTVAADTATDTLTLVAGSNVTITPDATNDKITIEAKDTVYTHPSSHDASMITQSASYRFVTDTEKSTWNAKASTATATTSANGLMSSSDKTKLNGIATGAEVNQNAFANVVVGSTTIAADAKQDTLTFVAGSNVTITPDATNDKITIAATDTVYTHPSSHDASMITQSANYRFVTDTEKATWNAKSNLALGTTSSTAFRGDQGLIAYNHSQAAHAPSNAQKNSDITKAEIEAKLTGLITSHTHNYLPTTTISDNIDLNTLTTTGHYVLKGSSCTNVPAAGNATVYVDFTVGTPYQLFMHDATFKLWYRSYNKTNSTWNAWTSTLGNSISGNAATATKVNNNMIVKLNSGSTEGTDLFTFNGSAAKTINITPASIGAAASSHGTHVTYSTSAPAANGTASAGSANNVARGDHVHPLQTTISGNAGSANKVNNNLVVKLNGGSTEGTNLFTFNGSAAKTVNITPSAIGAAPISHASTATTYGAASASNYGHAMASSTTPKANGTAAVGSETAKFARGDHVHPLQTTVSGNAGTATKLQTARTLTIGNTGKTFDGSANVSWSLAEMGAIPLTGNTGAYSITGNLEFSDAGTSGGFKGVVGKCGTNDYWRVGGLGIGSNDGRMEIATSDDGNEPIYVRQYSGVYSTLVRTATLLDASGNTSFPGSVTTGDKVTLQYNSTSESLDFIFI